MPIKPHPDYDEIKQAIQKLARRGRWYSGVCYRCTEPQFADQIVSGLGSQLHGARWTPTNFFPTVYLCDSVEAALQEYLARARRMRFPDHKSLPIVMAWLKVKAANLLDTTDAEVAAVINPLLATAKTGFLVQYTSFRHPARISEHYCLLRRRWFRNLGRKRLFGPRARNRRASLRVAFRRSRKRECRESSCLPRNLQS